MNADLSAALALIERAARERDAYRDAEAFLRFVANKDQVIAELDVAIAQRQGELATLNTGVAAGQAKMTEAREVAQRLVRQANADVESERARARETFAAEYAARSATLADLDATMATRRAELDSLKSQASVASRDLATNEARMTEIRAAIAKLAQG